jgi:hypothetical protein
MTELATSNSPHTGQAMLTVSIVVVILSATALQIGQSMSRLPLVEIKSNARQMAVSVLLLKQRLPGEDFVMKDLLPYMRKNFNVVQSREGTFITGISMGGMGSPRLAVKYPEVFQAVASLEPAIEPALTYDDITPRDKIGRPDGNPEAVRDRILLKQIYGDPIDRDY